MIVLFNWVIFRFHVNCRGCTSGQMVHNISPLPIDFPEIFGVPFPFQFATGGKSVGSFVRSRTNLGCLGLEIRCTERTTWEFWDKLMAGQPNYPPQK